ncbi:MAG: Asp-tRNA(Asn)/Glu-tRNA(Gln) amidotransferase subunit GatC [Acidobacteriales bacterium]|nr:Asp-tRNA(Asn)/Glu-tRNA(Gln) amidotransferase subunit GatC [Terriglobales bacterium]
MKVTEKEVAHVAGLANLELTAEESARMLHDLNAILSYIDRLNQMETANVQPLAQAPGLMIPGEAADDCARDDIEGGLRKSLPREEALENAPASDGTFFRVPKVIER